MLATTAMSSTRYLSPHANAAAAVRSFSWPARTSSRTAFGIRIAGARRSIKASRLTSANRTSSEASMTHASLTMDLVLQLLGGHLHDGYAPVREFVDEFRATRSRDLGSL